MCLIFFFLCCVFPHFQPSQSSFHIRHSYSTGFRLLFKRDIITDYIHFFCIAFPIQSALCFLFFSWFFLSLSLHFLVYNGKTITISTNLFVQFQCYGSMCNDSFLVLTSPIVIVFVNKVHVQLVHSNHASIDWWYNFLLVVNGVPYISCSFGVCVRCLHRDCSLFIALDVYCCVLWCGLLSRNNNKKCCNQ